MNLIPIAQLCEQGFDGNLCQLAPLSDNPVEHKRKKKMLELSHA